MVDEDGKCVMRLVAELCYLRRKNGFELSRCGGQVMKTAVSPRRAADQNKFTVRLPWGIIEMRYSDVDQSGLSLWGQGMLLLEWFHIHDSARLENLEDAGGCYHRLSAFFCL